MPELVNPPLPDKSRSLARHLRRAQTEAEARLWHFLRASRLMAYKFRRQHPVPPYVVDFYCDTAKVAVELDGSQHSETTDGQRTQFLAAQGIKVLRYWDHEALNDTEAVLASILAAIESRTLTPTPLPEGEGLEATRP